MARHRPSRSPPPSVPAPPVRVERRVALAVAFGTFVLYLVTLRPGIPGGDSGELVAASCGLGVAHPPGYPLHTMLGFLATLLPLGSPAARVNALSALCSALSAGLITSLVSQQTRRALIGLFSGACFASAPLIWRYAVGAEVFALNLLAVTATLWVTTLFIERPSKAKLWLGAGILGLGLTNHHTFVLVALPLTAWVLWKAPPSLRRPPVLAGAVAAFVLGLTPYLYLFLAARTPPVSSWGDTSTWSGFVEHLLRREYGTFRLGLSDTKPDPLRAFGIYLAHLVRATLGVGLGLAVVGVVRGGAFARVVAVCWATYLAFFLSLSNLPLDSALHVDVLTRFWLMADALVFVLAGLGLNVLVGGAQGRRPSWARWVPWMALAVPLLQLGVTFPVENQRGNRLFETFGHALLDGLPPNTLLVTRGDLFLNSVRYLQECEHVRPDVRVLDRELLKSTWFHDRVRRHYPDVVLPRGVLAPKSARVQPSYDLGELLAANASRPLFVSTLGADEDSSVRPRFLLRPTGFLHQVLPPGAPFELDHWLAVSAPPFAAFSAERLASERDGSWESAVTDVYFSASARRAGTVLAYALSQGNDVGAMNEARRLLEDIVRVQPKPPPAVWKDLGVTYFHLRAADPALTSRMVEVWTRFLSSQPAETEEVEQIRRLVAEHGNTEKR